MAKIYCHVCNKHSEGNVHATTCKTCLDMGYKYCKRCDTVKPLEEFTFLSSRNVYRPICKKCHSTRCSDYETNKRKTDEVFRLERNAKSAERMYIKTKLDIEWYEERKLKNSAWANNEYRTNPEYAQKIKQATSKRRHNIGTYTYAQWIECLKFFDYSCAYCGETHSLTVDHVIPVIKGGTDYIFNLVPACGFCNSSKRDNDVVEWYSMQHYYSESALKRIHTWFVDMQKYLSSEK